MPVTTVHPLYTKLQNQTTVTRDVIEGDFTIKSKGTIYVPKLSEQTTEEYTAYLNRPSLHNYTARVLDGLSGLVFSKDINMELSPTLDVMTEDISLSDTTIEDFTQELFSDIMTDGRTGILVDMAGYVGEITKAEAAQMNLRPYLSRYTHSSIINWKYTNINNRIKLTMVVLKESMIKVSTDEYSQETEDVYRVLSLRDGIYSVRLLKEDGSQYRDEIFPQMNGSNMDFIPFFGITPTTTSFNPVIPPLYDLAHTNLTQFKLDVDFYHGMHFTALPTPYGSGINLNKDEKVKVGSTTFMMFPDPQAKLEYLEFKGDGLGTIEREKENLFNVMVSLGSNLLKSDGNKAEAEETVRMRSKGQYASLSSVANTISRAMTLALEVMEMWSGGSQDVVFKLNTDFTDTTADAQTITATVNAWLGGALSDREKFEKLKKDNVIIDQNKTFEEHQQEIELNTVTVGDEL